MAAIVHGRIERGSGHDVANALPILFPMLNAEMLPSLDAAEALWRGWKHRPIASRHLTSATHGARPICARPVNGLGPRRDPAGSIGADQDAAPLGAAAQARPRPGLHGGGYTRELSLPVFTRDAGAMPVEEIRAALAEAGKGAGIDAFSFAHQPRIWEGTPNPLSRGGEPAQSDAYGLVLGPDPDSTIKRVFSADARRSCAPRRSA